MSREDYLWGYHKITNSPNVFKNGKDKFKLVDKIKIDYFKAW